MRIAGIIRDSLVNGEGIRDVVFVQGCNHHCKNCHNPNTWNPNGGKNIEPWDLADMFRDSPNNITVSGGEPFDQWIDMLQFMVKICAATPHKQFWIYTGYTYEQVKLLIEHYFLPYVSVIVDGEYIEELKNPDCLYRGSSNQRLIDVKKTAESGRIILWEETHEK